VHDEIDQPSNLNQETTMIKVSVMYPNGPDIHFDEAYYKDRHMPMVKELMGDYCKYYTVDRARSSDTLEKSAPYIAMGHLFCDSVEAFEAGFGPHTKVIMGDIPNYTNQKPVIQISEVLVG
jgi:uncharacterized protein (TIGR02118 family)